MPTMPEQPQLNPDEIELLVQGLRAWGGPARSSDAIATALGFSTAVAMPTEAAELADRLAAGEPLTLGEWRRVQAATEVMFASDVFGAGAEWEVVSGLDDHASLDVLRGLQRKLTGVR